MFVFLDISLLVICGTVRSQVLAFSAMLGGIEMDSGSIDKLETNCVKAIENLQFFCPML